MAGLNFGTKIGTTEHFFIVEILLYPAPCALNYVVIRAGTFAKPHLIYGGSLEEETGLLIKECWIGPPNSVLVPFSHSFVNTGLRS